MALSEIVSWQIRALNLPMCSGVFAAGSLRWRKQCITSVMAKMRDSTSQQISHK